MSTGTDNGASGVIVIGGGIGGLATARSLQRAGVAVRVYERAPDLSRVQVGGGFHLWTNAMRALRELGLDDRAGEIGAPIERTEYRTKQGELLALWPVGELAREHGVPDLGVNRRDLHRMLAESLDEGTVELGRELTDFREEGDGVVARFADGSQARAAALVGADGLRSRVRAALHGPEAPRFAGYTQWQTTMEDPGDLLSAGTEQVVFGPASRAILHHVGGGELFWAGVIYGPEGGAMDQREGRKQRLLEHFLDWRSAIAAAIADTPEERIVGLDIYDRPPAKAWGTGRTTLVGDAAHAMTTNLSQGGCQALEDSVVLGRCLGGGGDVPTALRTYERRRIPRTRALVKRSRRVSEVGAWQRPAACAARNRVLGQVLSGPGLADHRKFVAAPL